MTGAHTNEMAPKEDDKLFVFHCCIPRKGHRTGTYVFSFLLLSLHSHVTPVGDAFSKSTRTKKNLYFNWNVKVKKNRHTLISCAINIVNHTHTYTHARTHTHTHTYMHTHTQTYIHRTSTHARTHMYTSCADAGLVPGSADVPGLQLELLESLGDPLVKLLQVRKIMTSRHSKTVACWCEAEKV
jgi:hypothetical protein